MRRSFFDRDIFVKFALCAKQASHRKAIIEARLSAWVQTRCSSVRPYLVRTLLVFLPALPWIACKSSHPPSATSAVPPAAKPVSVVPQAPVPDTVTAQQGAERTPIGKGIRGVDLADFLNKHYAEVNPELEDLSTECGEGRDPLGSVAIEYGDLDGDGQDEAIYQGMTCMAGTAGIDFYGVLKMMPDGEVMALPIKEGAKEFKGRGNLRDGLRGKLELEIKDGRLLEVYPVYKGEDANCCPEGGSREFVYRWDGQQFVLDDIIDVPPAKSGN
jgi:hypothetical protein